MLVSHTERKKEIELLKSIKKKKKDILNCLERNDLWSHSKLVGLSIHIGSQLTDMQATLKAIKELSELALKIDHPLEFLDVGGGLGIDYTQADRKRVTPIEKYMRMVSRALRQHYYSFTATRPRIVFEPGRIIVGRMGVLVTKVIRTKHSGKLHFTIVDAGMNDLIRPALYDAHHAIHPNNLTEQKIKTNVVGPICETSDCFGEEIKISTLHSGDMLTIENTGAYGHSMSSTYNERKRPKEYLV